MIRTDRLYESLSGYKSDLEYAIEMLNDLIDKDNYVRMNLPSVLEEIKIQTDAVSGEIEASLMYLDSLNYRKKR